MTYKTKVLAFPYETRVKIFYILAGLLLATVTLYIYGVNAAIRNTVARQSLEEEIAELGGEAASLEFQYIGMRNSIDLSSAYERGLEDVKAPVFVSRTHRNTLSFNALNR